MASKSYDVVVIGAGLGASHVVEELIKKSKTCTIGYVVGFTYREFPIAASVFLNDPDQHKKYLCGESISSDTYKYSGVHVLQAVVAL